MNQHAASFPLSVAHAMQPVRAEGRINIRFKRHGADTVIADLGEGGGYRAKFPKGGNACEAVIINTGGGMTGGDVLSCSIEASAGTDAIVTTQSAEKLYRSSGLDARIDVGLRVETAGTLAWLPQETILFSGARIRRQITADIDKAAHLLIAESMVFGRIATGETLGEGLVRDRWRIRREGRLVFADETHFAGSLDGLLQRPAVLRDGRAMSTVLYLSPRAEALCEQVRDAMGDACATSGVSVWNGMLLARCVSDNPARLRLWVARVAGLLHGQALPRVWQC